MLKKILSLFLLTVFAAAQSTTGGAANVQQGNSTSSIGGGGGILPTINFIAVPNNISSGAAVLLSWTVTNSFGQSIDNGIGSVATTGSTTVHPGSTITYTLTATGAGGNAAFPVTITVNPLPTATLTASSLTIVQGSTITLTYGSTNTVNCDINNGILSLGTTACNGTTAPFSPPFTAPGPTVTTYIFTAHNANGNASDSKTITVNSTSLFGDDSRYCDPTTELTVYPGGVTTDGPATLPKYCVYTSEASTPSPGTVHTVAYTPGSPGTQTCGTAASDWSAALSSLACGDVVNLAQGCSLNCASANGCVLPQLHCSAGNWIKIHSVDALTGLPDVGFPVEGQRITPCDMGLSTLANYPDYSSDCLSRGGAKVRTFKFITTGSTAPALTFDLLTAPTCVSFPCASYYRIEGTELTSTPGLRTSSKLLNLSGGDHIIADRNIVHCQNDPLFRVECNGGILMNGTYIAAINNYVYDIFCANASTGVTCVDAIGISGGTGGYRQKAHKVEGNFIAASGESWFWGGAGNGFYPTTDNPDGQVSDTEVRRNFSFKPLSWFLNYPYPSMVITSVNTSGVYQGTIFGGSNNALVGRTFRISGFTNLSNNISPPGALVTASSATSITFNMTTIVETPTLAASASNQEPHWDPKNLGETKDTVRGLWEGNVCYNSWYGFQSDQFGNCNLATPKNANHKINVPAGDTVTGSTAGGLFYINCVNGSGTCSAAGKPLFTCSFDPNAVPDWTGAGVTVASCGNITAFACAAGQPAIGPFSISSVDNSGVYTGTFTGGAANAFINRAFSITGFTNVANGATTAPKIVTVTASTATTISTSITTVSETSAATGVSINDPNCPGSYLQTCSSIGDNNKCAVLVGTLNTGTYYHILNYINADQVQVVEDSTSLSTPVVPNLYDRGLNPYAVARHLTIRFGILAHVANGFEISSAAADGGADALGVHNISLHDFYGFDMTPVFWSNLNNCCNAGWAVKILSGTVHSNVVPSDISIHNISAALIGYQSSSSSGLLNLLDTKCKNPVVSGVCANGVIPAYFPRLSVYNNITASSQHMTANGANFTPNTQAFALGLYGCSGHNGATGCDYVVHKNLQLFGLWAGQTNQIPNINLLTYTAGGGGTNGVEDCSCSVAGGCTAGTPNTWGAQLISGALNACDWVAPRGYTDVFTTYDPTNWATVNLQLPSNSPYRGYGFNGGDLGANASVLQYTAGVATPTIFIPIDIDGYYGNTSCVSPCALPAATHGTYYTQTLHRSGGAGPWQVWTILSGAIPTGVTFDNHLGVLAGTPTLVGNFTFAVQIEDAGHQTDGPYTFTVQVN